MVQGGAYEGTSDQTVMTARLSPPANLPLNFTLAHKSGNLSMNWKRALSATSEWSLKFYYDYYERQSVVSGERRDTYDVDFQHRALWAGNHDIVWGLGWRQTSDDMDDKLLYSFIPQDYRDQVFSAFVQDEIALAMDRLRLIVGTKAEHNEHTGLEYQPNLRLLWKIDDRQTGWAAVSRAVRTPARSDLGVRIDAGVFPGIGGRPSTLARITGNSAVQSEDLIAYEVGYRTRPSERLHLDVTAFTTTIAIS
jgi:iron complex outermembrane receptor protein